MWPNFERRATIGYRLLLRDNSKVLDSGVYRGERARSNWREYNRHVITDRPLEIRRNVATY